MFRTAGAAAIRDWVMHRRYDGRRVALVPTMGALHAGHVSLIEHAAATHDDVVVSIFVNPTQFAPHEDLTRYPRPLEADLAACEAAGATAVFTPTVDDVHPPGSSASVRPPDVARTLEGRRRPGHFEGVCTVVLQLFQMAPVQTAVFGRKDYQQWRVIEAMTRDLHVPVDIVGRPIVRADDGLALSSRNAYLSPEERGRASAISRSLEAAKDRAGTVADVERTLREGLTAVDEVEYATVRDATTLQTLPPDHSTRGTVALIAAKVGTTRLIDNAEL